MWAVYYDDGSTWTDADGPVEDTPGLGAVVVLVQPDEGESFVIVGHDFYCWHADQGRWWGADQSGVWDYLHRPGWRKVVFGRTVSNADYGAVHARAMRDAGMIQGGSS
jgi:hypothetical protein